MTPELVGQLAEHAGLSLSPDRQAALVPFLRELLDGAARLEEVDVTSYEPPRGFEVPAIQRVGR